jgi:hypothetical protein
MKTVALLVVLLLAAGCASVNKIDSGERRIGDRLVVQLDGAWNHVDAPMMGPAQTWTMEGLTIDQLIIYSGHKDGQPVHASGGGQQKSFSFRSTMQPDEIVAMFEGMLTRDGSTFKLGKLEPVPFGERGFRFEYSVVRKVDNVQLSGVGYGTVSKGELFAMLYMAPRITFFSRHQGRVEQMARSAKVL